MWQKLPHEQQLIVLGLVVSIILGIIISAFRYYFPAPQEKLILNTSPSAVMVIVHISGAVRKEGVYRLKTGDRVIDLLEMAGGALPQADLSIINLAEVVKDGEKIIVPEKEKPEEKISEQQKSRKAEKQTGKIRLNSADAKALDALPGVGPATAKAIVEYRKTNGPFTKIEQLMKIPRFGKGKFERLKDMVTL